MRKRLLSFCAASTTLAILMTCGARPDTIEPRGVAALGDDSAAVVLMFFTDYRCGACRSFSASVLPHLRPLVDVGRLRIVVADIGPTSKSRQIAVAARCAREFGKYWPFLDALAERPSAPMDNVAKTAGVPVGPFSRCIDSDRYAGAVAQATDVANAHGVAAAPALFLGPAARPTRRVLDTRELSATVIDSLVRRELRKCGC